MVVTKLNTVDFDKIVLLGIEEVYGFSRKDKSLLFAFDQPKSGELTGNNDVTYAEGKRGVRLATLKNNKTTGFSCENGYVVYSALAHQWGAEVEEATDEAPVKIRRIEFHKGAASVELDARYAIEGLQVYLANEDRTKKEQVAVTSNTADSAAEGSTAKITTVTMPTDVDADAQYMFVYDELVHVAKRIVNSSEKFAEDVELVINMLGQHICDETQYLIQCRMPKASVSGEWNLSLGSDPAVHNFSAEAMYDVCQDEAMLSELIIC